MQTERRVVANPQTKPIDLGCESAENWQLPSTSTVTTVNSGQLSLASLRGRLIEYQLRLG